MSNWSGQGDFPEVPDFKDFKMRECHQCPAQVSIHKVANTEASLFFALILSLGPERLGSGL